MCNMDATEKRKNIKDLEYNDVLNKQNIILVLVGTASFSVLLAEKLPAQLQLAEIVIPLLLAGLISFLYFRKKLQSIKQEIATL